MSQGLLLNQHTATRLSKICTHDLEQITTERKYTLVVVQILEHDKMLIEIVWNIFSTWSW